MALKLSKCISPSKARGVFFMYPRLCICIGSLECDDIVMRISAHSRIVGSISLVTVYIVRI